jgi:hypothetical protein
MSRTIEQRPNKDGFVKPGELIEISPMQELTLQDTRPKSVTFPLPSLPNTLCNCCHLGDRQVAGFVYPMIAIHITILGVKFPELQ